MQTIFISINSKGQRKGTEKDNPESWHKNYVDGFIK